MKKDEIINNLYLNQIAEINLHRKKLNPIRQKNISLSPTNHLSGSKSVTDIFKNLNGSVIIQNWNTKKTIPKNIGELINLPSLIDLKKLENNNNLIKLDKPHDKLSLLEKIKLSNGLEKFNKNEKIKSLKIDTFLEGNISPPNSINKINFSNKSLIFKGKLRRSSSTISSDRRNQDSSNTNSLIPYGETNKNNENENDTNMEMNNNITNSSLNINSLIMLKSPRVFKLSNIHL